MGFQISFLLKSPIFLSKTLDKYFEKCGASRLLINKYRPFVATFIFRYGGDFILLVNCGTHADYQNFVIENLCKYYPDPDAISRDTWDIIDRFCNLDLSYTDEMMRSKYPKFGPAPRTPSCMQRSYLLSIDFKVMSVTEWAAQLKINPLYALLSGFEVGDTPGIGTFYDFFSKLWNSEDKNLNPHLHKLKVPVKKPVKKGCKAQPVDKTTIKQLMKTLENQSFSIDEQPYGSLFDLYIKEFLRKSLDRELINNTHLSIAGDGTRCNLCQRA